MFVTDMTIRRVEGYALGFVITILVSINAFFIKDLVSNIERTAANIEEVRNRLVIVETKMNFILKNYKEN